MGNSVVENGLPKGFEKFARRDDGKWGCVTNRFLLEVSSVPCDEVIHMGEECCGQDRGVIVMDEFFGSFDGCSWRVGGDAGREMFEEGSIIRQEGRQFVCQITIRFDEHLARQYCLDNVRLTET